jgi:regulator of sirC expression with transglutaminase-like and TPR domain
VTGRTDSLAAELQGIVASEPVDLARAALVIAKLEYPNLDPRPSLARLDDLGEGAAQAVAPLAGAPVSVRLAAIAEQLYGREGYAGNHAHYDDFRNSCLNAVLERRLGIPITLALLYVEVARRAGVEAHGVSFPGHFLLRGPDDDTSERPPILDPFDAGRPLGEPDLRALLVRMAGEDAVYTPDLLRPCPPRQLLARMLNNLKRTYVETRSFQQARAATHLIVAVEPTLLSELRDRGLLAYHMNDFASALRDLEDFVKLHAWAEHGDKDERDEIWNHVKNLRRRVAGLN